MPRSFKRRRSFSRRKSFRRRPIKKRRIVRRQSRVRRNPTVGIANSKTIKLCFSDSGTNGLSIPAANFIALSQYKLNSAYDIDAQILSESIVGFNEWKNFYNRYHVTWAKIEVDFRSISAFPLYCGIVMRPVTSETTWNTWKDWRGIEGNGFPQKIFLLSQQGGAKDSVRLTLKAPLWKVLGNKKEYMSDVGFAAAMTENPTRIIDAFVYVLAPTAATVTNALTVFTKIKITIYVKLFGRKLLKQSNFTGPEEGNQTDPTIPDTLPEYPTGDIDPDA